MPDYDLGRARGKITIDTDNRGADKADKALASLAKVAEKLEAVVIKLDRTLDRLEGQLNDVASAARKADDALDDIDGSFVSVHKSSTRAGSSVGDFNSNLADTVVRARQLMRVAAPLYRAYDHIHSSMRAFNDADGFRSYLRAANKATMATLLIRKAFGAVGGQLLGVNKAYAEFSDRQNKILKLAGKASVVAAGFAAINKLGPGLAKFAGNLGAVQKVGRGVAGVLQKAIDTATTGEGRFLKLSTAVAKVAFKADEAGASFHRLYKTGNLVSNTLNSIGGGLVKTMVGLKIAQSGLSGIRKQFEFLSKGRMKLVTLGVAAAFGLIGPAAEIGAKGLKMLSNGFNLLWNAVKQLSGGLLAIPGIFATIGGAIIPVMVSMKRLGKTFGDVFKAKDAEELAAALEALPEHLRPLGKRLAEVKKTLEEIGDAGVESFLGKDAIKEIDALESALKGPIIKNFQLINNAARQFRQELVSVLSDGQNITGLNQIFQSSRKFIDNMRDALSPFVDGMRDLVVVGSQFFADFTSGASGLTQKFAEWASVARESGKLRQYMDDAVAGAKNLVRGLVSATKALWSLLTLFATDNGDNALERFAKSMKKFNDAVNRSKADGVLRKIADTVKSMGFERLEKLKNTIMELAGPIGDLLKTIAPMARAFSDAFSDKIVFAIKVAAKIIEEFFAAFSGLESVIGWVLGFVAAGKLIATVVKPMLNAAKAVAGLIIAMKGLQAVLYSNKMIALVGILDRLLPGTNKASSGFDKLEGAIGRAGSAMRKFAGAAGLIAAVGFAMWEMSSTAQDTLKDFDNSLAENKRSLEDYKTALRGAFAEDNGLVGKNVFDTVTNQMSDMRTQLDKQAGDMPGVFKNISDWWANQTSPLAEKEVENGWGQSTKFNELQKASDDAKHAKEQFDQLGLSSSDLATIVTSTDTSFKGLVQTLRDAGKSDAANSLEAQRGVYKAIQSDFETMSPNAVALSNAIAAIGDAGSDTAAKLSALKAALSALGLDKTTEIENAFAYSEAIRKMGVEAKNAVDSSAGLDKIFGPDGLINTIDGGVNAENLFSTVSDAVEKFKARAVESGADVNTEFQRLIETVPQLAEAFTVAGGDVEKTKQNIMGLIQSLGADAGTIDILLALKGEDKIKSDIANLILNYSNLNGQGEIKIPLTADKTQLQTELDKILGSGVAAVGDQSITIGGVNVNPQVLKQLQDAIPGLSVPGAPPPKPAEVETKPVPAAGKPGQGAPAAPNAPPSPVQPPPPVDTTQIDQANAKIKELQDKITALQTTPIAPTIDPTLIGQLDQISAKVAEVQEKVNSFTANDIKFKIVAEGVNETVYVLSQQIPQAIQTTRQAADTIAQSFIAAFSAATSAGTSMVNTISSAIAGLVAGASAQGSAFVDAFAAGLSSNPAAVNAATAMANEIKARFHQSPPKKGPLSAHGDAAYYAGGKFVDAYAGGMNANSSAVGAANSLAGGVGQRVQGPYDLGRLLGAVNDILSIGSKLSDIFGQISESIFQTMKLVSDPLGKGTFFGQSLGSALGWRRDPEVTNAELAQNRVQVQKDEKAQTPEEKKQADQAKSDAEKQNEITSALLDEVVAGRRIAAPTDEEKKTETDAKKEANKQAKAEAKAAGKTVPSTKGQPKTDAELAKVATQAGADLSRKLESLSPEDLALVQAGEVSVKTDDQILAELVKQTPLLQGVIDVSKDSTATESESIKALQALQPLIDAQGDATTPAAKQQKAALESISSTIQSNAGLTTGQNPIDQASSIAGSIANTASDIFASIQSVMDSFGAANELSQTLVRGVENSEDVMKIIDNVQQFITTAAQIAQAVASGLNVASGIAGASGGTDGGAASGGLAAASQIASLVSGALSTVNAVIDLAQETYRIAGKYVGQFLGFLTGGAGGQLMGDVRFLLDKNDGTLKTWSRDNPEDKRSHDNPFQNGGMTDQTPKIGEINVFGGPGQDPREMTSEMMFAVSAASSGAWSD